MNCLRGSKRHLRVKSANPEIFLDKTAVIYISSTISEDSHHLLCGMLQLLRMKCHMPFFSVFKHSDFSWYWLFFPCDFIIELMHSVESMESFELTQLNQLSWCNWIRFVDSPQSVQLIQLNCLCWFDWICQVDSTGSLQLIWLNQISKVIWIWWFKYFFNISLKKEVFINTESTGIVINAASEDAIKVSFFL